MPDTETVLSTNTPDPARTLLTLQVGDRYYVDPAGAMAMICCGLNTCGAGGVGQKWRDGDKS